MRMSRLTSTDHQACHDVGSRRLTDPGQLSSPMCLTAAVMAVNDLHMGDDRVPGTNAAKVAEYVCPVDSSERKSTEGPVPECPKHRTRMKLLS